MTDIYDIKELYFKGNEGFFLSLIVFISALLYYIFSKIFVKNKKQILEKDELFEEKIDFENEFSKFEEKMLEISSNDFLKKLSYLFKLFLEKELKKTNLTKMTLDEIKNIELGGDIFDLIKELYLLEYRELEVDLDNRKNIYSKVIKIIFNK